MKKLLVLGLLSASLLTACNDNNTTPTTSTGTTTPVTSGGGTTTTPPATVSTLTHLGGTVYRGVHDSTAEVITPQPWIYGQQGVQLIINTGTPSAENLLIVNGTVDATGQLSLDLPLSVPTDNMQDLQTQLATADTGSDSSYINTCTNTLTLSNPAMKGSDAVLAGQSQTDMATISGLQNTNPFTYETMEQNQYGLVFVNSSGTINGTTDCSLALKTDPNTIVQKTHTTYNNVLLLKGWNSIMSKSNYSSSANGINTVVSNVAIPTIWYSGISSPQ